MTQQDRGVRNVYCAVYGTLRPGDYNSERFSEGGSATFHRGFRIPGVLYDGGLPFLDAFDTSSEVVVDIIELDPESRRWEQICYMEIGAGYSAVVCQPTNIETGVPFEHPCIVWHANDAARRGRVVPSGDWKKKPQQGYQLDDSTEGDDDPYYEFDDLDIEDLEDSLD
jgi:gamma-glutamylcyclotransferase (GGCT)/AIG2-like uncharacterized protein YtfP